MENNKNFNYGWVCSKCGKSLSPWTGVCYYCSNVQTIPIVNISAPLNWKYDSVTPTVTSSETQKNTGDFPVEPRMQDILYDEGYPTQPMGAL